jgi:hypothetical protein
MQAPALEPQELHFDMKHSPNPTRCAKTQSQEVQSAEAELLARTPVLTAEDDEGTNNSTREASNAASAVSTIHSTSSNGQALWHHAKEKVMAFVDFSMGFHTLRDMTGNHTLDPRKLKLICRLGSKAHAPQIAESRVEAKSPFRPFSCGYNEVYTFHYLACTDFVP